MQDELKETCVMCGKSITPTYTPNNYCRECGIERGWIKTPESIFELCIKVILDTDPKTEPEQWDHCWEVILSYKNFRERKFNENN
jgi:hypothetical protein